MNVDAILKKIAFPKRRLGIYDLAFPVVALGILFFHLTTLQVPSWTQDEGNFADYALHGRLTTWEHLLYGQTKFLIYHYGLWDTWFLHFKVINFFLTTLGIGIWQLRIGPFLLHVLGILTLLYAFRKHNFPSVASWSLLAYASSPLFFFLSHCGRPEGAIFFLTALNFAWFLSGKSRSASLLCGLLTAAGLGFHQNVIFIMLTVPLLFLFCSSRDKRALLPFLYWLTGCLTGVLIYISHLSIDAAICCYMLEKSRIGYENTLFAKNLPNMGHQVISMIQLLDNPNARFLETAGRWQLIFAISLLSFPLIYARRFHQRTLNEKALIVVCLSFTALFILLTPHQQYKYFDLIFPWIFPASFLCVEEIFQKKIVLGKMDAVIGASMVFLFFYPYSYSPAQIIVLTALVQLIVLSALIKFLFIFLGRKSNALRMGTAGLAAVLLLANFNWVIYMLRIFKAVFLYRPLLVLAFIIFPLITIQNGKTKGRWISLRPIDWSPAAAFLFTFSLSINFYQEWRLIAQRSRQDNLAIEAFLVMSKELRNERLVAPNYFWLLNPALALQCNRPLLLIHSTYPNSSISFALKKYKPSVVFLPDSYDFNALMKPLIKNKEWLDPNETWDTPGGFLRKYISGHH